MKIVWGACIARAQWVNWIITAGVVGGAVLACHSLGIMLCPFHRLTGFPCPACGSTRALAALLTGHFTEAVRHNLLFVIAFFCAAVFLAVELPCAFWLRRAPRLMLSGAEKNVFAGVVTLVVLAHWAWALFHCPMQ